MHEKKYLEYFLKKECKMNLDLQKCREKIRNFSNRWRLKRKYKGYVIDEENFKGN